MNQTLTITDSLWTLADCSLLGRRAESMPPLPEFRQSLPVERRPPCTCRHPKPGREVDETFEGLFADTPITAFDAIVCNRCGGMLCGWQPCEPTDDVNPDDFPELVI